MESHGKQAHKLETALLNQWTADFFAGKGHVNATVRLPHVRRGPELFRLQQACLLLDELCLVASPLRDTLRFLQREILNCTFANYKPGPSRSVTGADILQLTPFFVLRAHELAQGEADRQRALAADKEIEALKCRLEEAKKQVQSLKQELQKELRT
eukprot:s54_g3.t1